MCDRLFMANQEHGAAEAWLQTGQVETYLKVFQGELQHVSEDIAEDLCLLLHQHTLILQRLNDLRFYLQNMNETKP